MIVKEQYQESYLWLFFLLAMITLGIVYWKIPLHQDEWDWDNKWVFISIPSAALITYFLHHDLGLGPVFAAGIVGTLGTYLYRINPKSIYLKQIGTPIYCGAFVGMSSMEVSYSYIIIFIAAFFSSILYFGTKSLFVGVGGKLGTVAFIGVVISMLLLKLLFG